LSDEQYRVEKTKLKRGKSQSHSLSKHQLILLQITPLNIRITISFPSTFPSHGYIDLSEDLFSLSIKKKKTPDFLGI